MLRVTLVRSFNAGPWVDKWESGDPEHEPQQGCIVYEDVTYARVQEGGILTIQRDATTYTYNVADFYRVTVVNLELETELDASTVIEE